MLARWPTSFVVLFGSLAAALGGCGDGSMSSSSPLEGSSSTSTPTSTDELEEAESTTGGMAESGSTTGSRGSSGSDEVAPPCLGEWVEASEVYTWPDYFWPVRGIVDQSGVTWSVMSVGPENWLSIYRGDGASFEAAPELPIDMFSIDRLDVLNSPVLTMVLGRYVEDRERIDMVQWTGSGWRVEPIFASELMEYADRSDNLYAALGADGSLYVLHDLRDVVMVSTNASGTWTTEIIEGAGSAEGLQVVESSPVALVRTDPDFAFAEFFVARRSELGWSLETLPEVLSRGVPVVNAAQFLSVDWDRDELRLLDVGQPVSTLTTIATNVRWVSQGVWVDDALVFGWANRNHSGRMQWRGDGQLVIDRSSTSNEHVQIVYGDPEAVLAWETPDLNGANRIPETLRYSRCPL